MQSTHINTFIKGTMKVMKDFIDLDLTRTGLRKLNKDSKGSGVFVNIGITGTLSGNVHFNIPMTTAKSIASKAMMGMEVKEFDDMPKSVISEITNMIMGNVATLLSELEEVVDITPPFLVISDDFELYDDALDYLEITFGSDLGPLKVAISIENGGKKCLKK